MSGDIPSEIDKMSAEGSKVEDVVKIPFFGIQCDWEESFKKPNETAWVSLRRHGQQRSTHGDIIFRRKDPLDVEALAEPFEVVDGKTTTNYVTVKDTETNCECSFLAPDAVFNKIHNSPVTCLDVTEGGLGVSGSNDQLKVWELQTGKIRRTYDGHEGEIVQAKFFRSGLVFYSCGADWTIKIFSAEDGSNPRTLKGHKGTIRDCCAVEKGRNIVSVSVDSTVRLWDVGEGKCLDILYKCPESAINSCCLSSPTAIPLGNPIQGKSEREIGTEGKLLVMVTEKNFVTGISVASRKLVFSLPIPSAGNCVVSTGPNTFAIGCQNGEILMLNARTLPPTIRHIASATQTPILALMTHPRSPNPNRPGVEEFNKSFWAAKADGTCVLINPTFATETTTPARLIQLTGPDNDPIYQVKHDNNFVYTSCRDGKIRRYSLGLIGRILE